MFHSSFQQIFRNSFLNLLDFICLQNEIVYEDMNKKSQMYFK